MSDEKRSSAQKQARPFGLRGKWRQAALQGLARERPLPAPCALPGVIWRSNAARRETATDPKCAVTFLCTTATKLNEVAQAFLPHWRLRFFGDAGEVVAGVGLRVCSGISLRMSAGARLGSRFFYVKFSVALA
ncbi:hypothetical protein [Pseudomonas sp.]|uniref:hypothetical protein n=1 Tax=Pseudomonas sp. TaxID=306 RepID=UPI0027324A50|nr:hypothetical protein [Pseudomonas sp.]MDP3813616.1 hypothetical protein [Pseudomonas sp.]